MKTDELNSLILSGQPHLLIDVLPEEVHAAGHIPGSTNVCVYEMVFTGSVAELAPMKDTVIVVYGAGEGSRDSKTAAEKLKAAGYVNVLELPAGLAGWQAAGFPVRGHGRLPEVPKADGDYVIDTVESIIRWTGRNLFNHHNGTVKLAAGHIRVSSGVLESAVFSIDMNSVACEDIPDEGMRGMLIRHLKDADFFDTANYPIAEFVTTPAQAIPNSSEGNPNYLLTGNFTLRGITRPISFPAVIATSDGRRLTGQAQLEIDRTEFGSIYGSGKFFKYLGKHVVNDIIHLHLKIHADSVARD